MSSIGMAPTSTTSPLRCPTTSVSAISVVRVIHGTSSCWTWMGTGCMVSSSRTPEMRWPIMSPPT
ncbi:MAG: hypothetical protein R2699_00090 [Acidimicrobiales bacterium]